MVIWEWPAAIECWLSEELDIKWEAAELDLDTSVFDDYLNSLE